MSHHLEQGIIIFSKTKHSLLIRDSNFQLKHVTGSAITYTIDINIIIPFLVVFTYHHMTFDLGYFANIYTILFTYGNSLVRC